MHKSANLPCVRRRLREIRGHNALLFDFVLKRSLASGSARFPRGVFETQPFFFDPT